MAAQGGVEPKVGHSAVMDTTYREIREAELTICRDDKNNKILLGSGGFANVYLGEYEKTGNTKVAIKKLKNTEAGFNDRDLKLLKKEAKNMFDVRHPDIVTVFGICCDKTKKGKNFNAIVVEYMERGSLENLVEEVELPDSLKTRILRDVARGLVFMYNTVSRPIQHGDIKAANIFIDGNFKAKIGDFGTSKLQKITTRISHIRHDGTVTHAAPEFLHPVNDVVIFTEKCDVWSFGIAVFELCAHGKGDPDTPSQRQRLPFPDNYNNNHIMDRVKVTMDPLFTDEQKRKLPSDCPRFLVELMENCCNPNPDSRPTFKDILHILNDKCENFYKRCSDKDMSDLYGKLGLQKPSPSGDLQSIQPVENPLHSNVDSRMSSVRPPQQETGQINQSQQPNVPVTEQGATTQPGTVSQSAAGTYQTRYDSTSGSQSSQMLNLMETDDQRSQEFRQLQAQAEMETQNLDRLRQQYAALQAQNAQQKEIDDLRLMYQKKEQDVARLHQLVQQLSSDVRRGFGNLASRDDVNRMAAGSGYPPPAYGNSGSVIMDNYTFLKENTNADSLLADWLYQYRIINEEDIELIQTSRTTSEKLDIILKKVNKKGEDGLKKFMTALKETDQEHVVSHLEQARRIRNEGKNDAQLAENIKHPESIVNALFGNELIDIRTKERLSLATLTTIEKAERMLYEVRRIGPAAMDVMIRCLEDDNQQELADSLKRSS